MYPAMENLRQALYNFHRAGNTAAAAATAAAASSCPATTSSIPLAAAAASASSSSSVGRRSLFLEEDVEGVNIEMQDVDESPKNPPVAPDVAKADGFLRQQLQQGEFVAI